MAPLALPAPSVEEQGAPPAPPTPPLAAAPNGDRCSDSSDDSSDDSSSTSNTDEDSDSKEQDTELAEDNASPKDEGLHEGSVDESDKSVGADAEESLLSQLEPCEIVAELEDLVNDTHDQNPHYHHMARLLKLLKEKLSAGSTF